MSHYAPLSRSNRVFVIGWSTAVDPLKRRALEWHAVKTECHDLQLKILVAEIRWQQLPRNRPISKFTPSSINTFQINLLYILHPPESFKFCRFLRRLYTRVSCGLMVVMLTLTVLTWGPFADDTEFHSVQTFVTTSCLVVGDCGEAIHNPQ